MRDYDNSSQHCNGINSLAIAGNANGQTNLLTASRDRLIKIWQVDYAKMMQTSGQRGMTLMADLDDHMDWVNQIKLIEEVNTLISCSNDTTIRVWRYKQNASYARRNEELKKKRSK